MAGGCLDGGATGHEPARTRPTTTLCRRCSSTSAPRPCARPPACTSAAARCGSGCPTCSAPDGSMSPGPTVWPCRSSGAAIVAGADRPLQVRRQRVDRDPARHPRLQRPRPADRRGPGATWSLASTCSRAGRRPRGTPTRGPPSLHLDSRRPCRRDRGCRLHGPDRVLRATDGVEVAGAPPAPPRS